MRYFIVLFFLSISICNLYSQVEIELKSGEKVKGYLLSKKDSVVILSLPDSTLRRIPENNIESTEELTTTVKLNDGTDYDVHIEKMDSNKIYFHDRFGAYVFIDRPDIQSMEIEAYDLSRYISFGATVLGPSYLNLVFGFKTEPDISMKFFAGTDIHTRYYLHFDLGYCIYKSRSIENNISLGGGIGKKTDPAYYGKDDSYFGIFFDANIGGIFLETGLILYGAISSNSKLMLGIGYVYRFID